MLGLQNRRTATNVFRFTHTTRRARKQFYRLSQQHQEQCRQKLRQLLPTKNLELYTGGELGGQGLAHFHVSRNLILVVVVDCGRVIVLCVGTHDETEDFAGKYTGELPDDIITLAEAGLATATAETEPPDAIAALESHLLETTAGLKKVVAEAASSTRTQFAAVEHRAADAERSLSRLEGAAADDRAALEAVSERTSAGEVNLEAVRQAVAECQRSIGDVADWVRSAQALAEGAIVEIDQTRDSVASEQAATRNAIDHFANVLRAELAAVAHGLTLLRAEVVALRPAPRSSGNWVIRLFRSVAA